MTQKNNPLINERSDCFASLAMTNSSAINIKLLALCFLLLAPCSLHRVNAQGTFNCGDSLIDTRDGFRNVYSTKYFGPGGCWMTQNLRYFTPIGGMRINPGKYDGSAPIIVNSLSSIHSTGVTDNIKYNEGSNANTTVTVTRDAFTQKFGILYAWDSAMNKSTVDGSQGICPAGWHIPSDMEWSVLESAMCVPAWGVGTADTWNPKWADSSNNSQLRPNNSSTGHGRLMKAENTFTFYGQAAGTGGTSPSRWNGNVSDSSSGFNALPSGLVISDVLPSKNSEFGCSAYWWSSSERNSTGALFRQLYNYSSGVLRYSLAKAHFFSVRCKKN